MGEKLLAQRIIVLLRETTGRDSAAARALLDWAGDNKEWLWPGRTVSAGKGKKKAKGERLDWGSLPALVAAVEVETAAPRLFETLDRAARLLAFDSFDAALLRAVAGMTRADRLSRLCDRLDEAGCDLVALAGRAAGAGEDAAARVRRSAPVSLGLIEVAMPRRGGCRLELEWRFAQLLDQGVSDDDRLIEALAGTRQRAALAPDAFEAQRRELDLLVRLLRGAAAHRASGINILVHGPPGTGKTEFARMLADAAGAELFAVGECDADGEEPTRWERLHALKRAQRLLARRAQAVLLFDEMEDLFANASETAGGGLRAGSKIFVNRMLEGNAVPVIWTSNDILSVDAAHLRRMSFVLRMDHPAAAARARMVGRIAAEEQAESAVSGLEPLLGAEPEAAAVARVALRCASLAGGDAAADAEAAARSLLLGLRGGRALPPLPGTAGLDLSLYDGGADMAGLIDRVVEPGAPRDFSLLLTGPPGTGKTALAAYLAERLDRPLKVKRASDLLSKWVGGTEANIAEAFAEARDEEAVLLFDEADSLLLDRQDAQRSWEITQVNELLTWMDSHPLPFVAATNYAERLDPAALRRFVFKVALKALSGAAADRAWNRFFGGRAPAALADVAGLTPGDFAVVKRQLRYRGDAGPGDILGLLAAEAAAKPERPVKIGF